MEIYLLWNNSSSVFYQELDWQRKYNQLMNLLTASKMAHGTCLPIEAKACTACGAKRKVDLLISEYAGPPKEPK